MENTELKDKLLALARDCKIPCALAFKLAAESGVKIAEIGKMADELEIKITSCQLGCF